MGLNLRVEVVAESSLASLKSIAGIERLSNADLSVWFLARTYKNALILTDDLALRRVLENEGFLVVGSVGILFRAYTEGRMNKAELIQAINKLFTESSLYLSEGLKRRVMKRLKAIDC
jgi:predicted nucleic acid-binding protein